MGRGKKGRKLLLLALIGAGYAAFKAKNKNLSPAAAWEAPTPRPADPSPPTEKEPVAETAPAPTDVTPEEGAPEEVAPEEVEAEEVEAVGEPAQAPAEPTAEDAVVADVTGEVTGDPLSDPLADPLSDPAPAAEDDGSFFEQVMAETTDQAKPAPRRRSRRTAKDKSTE